ncbi:hypothetical protein [Streptomyces sp. 1222.5]|uniref:hypothetical protein n=1 Tax=Streptomyces sp. 1222.5 TaxID=1881026 RepID=UPI003D71E893
MDSRERAAPTTARAITTPISPTYARQILDLQEAGATEEDLHPIVAEAITESYFTEWGTRADGLRADFTMFRPSNSRSDAVEFRACYKAIRRVVVQLSGGGPL